MKFLIVGDLHGRKPMIHFKDFDAIIAPGDFCATDKIRPLLFQSLKTELTNPKKKIKWYDLCGKKEAKKLVEESVKKGREILEGLNTLGVPVYLVPGNNDWIGDDKKEKWDFLKNGFYSKLLKGFKNLIDVHNKSISIDCLQIIGHGISSGPEYPQHKEALEKLSKKELEKKKKEYDKEYNKIVKLFEKARKPVIFLSHNVPFNTPIDKITDKNSPRAGYHYGSLLARKIIEKYQPLICIGGHMHEHFDKCKIGKTVCVNSGFGSFVNILLEIAGGKIKRLEFWDGKGTKKEV